VDRIPDASSMPFHAPTRSRYDPAHPEGLPYVPPDPLIELTKRVVDPYKHMEVKILKGPAKRHFGTIIGTRRSPEGDELVDVLTSTQAINTVITYHVKHVKERL
jgi:hypothetical protein